MPRKLIFCLLPFIFFILLFSTYSTAQSRDGSASQNGFNLDLSDQLGGIYYQDPLGIQLSSRLLPFEGTIDPNVYQLGPNDLISITINSAKSVFLRMLVVNPQGEVMLPLVGLVKIGGLTISEAEKHIKKVSSDSFKNHTVNLTVENPRPVIIHVAGGVPYPGKYIVPAQSRVDQAIFSSITSGNRDISKSVVNSSDFLKNHNFSFRKILIERNGNTISADLIDFFRNGNFDSNPYVKTGDLIRVSKIGPETPKVSISGAVLEDIEIEFLENDTPEKLLRIGGGFEDGADQSKLYVFRKSEATVDRIEIPFDKWSTFKLEPNDRVVAAFNIDTDASASAWVYGEVEVPGNFPITSGQTTALQLLGYAGNLTNRALPKAAYLMRSGGWRNEIPNKFNADLMKRTSDQLVQGLEYFDAETQLSRNKVFIDLNDQVQLQNLQIFDGDRLYVPRDEQTVFVFGQINNPGYYPFEQDKPVNQYIRDAGGFSLSADENRIFVIKAGNATWFSPKETNLESGDRIFIDRNPVEELNALRTFEIQKQQLKNQRAQLIMTGITTITGIITTYVAIRRL